MMKLHMATAVTICTMAILGAAVAQDRNSDNKMDKPNMSATQNGIKTMSQNEMSQTHALHRASKIIGANVMDAQGKKVGDIKDVVLDQSRGQIAYAVVSFGGLMGVGSKYFAVPWKSLQTSAENNYVLNVDKDTLKRAPGFDKNHWPDMASEQWNTDVYRHYNQTPYWQGSSGSSGSSGGN